MYYYTMYAPTAAVGCGGRCLAYVYYADKSRSQLQPGVRG